jgi:glycosyltransferase involved in cell wall biosynthesis
MKIGYILTTFPNRAETFAAGEIESLRKLGFRIVLFAANAQMHVRQRAETVRTFYRPTLLSLDSVTSIGYMLVGYPLAFGKLICLILKLMRVCPREAISLAGNLHTVCFFARSLDHEGISHIHAYFLNWPATIGLALSVITGRPFSISAHARDIFVEHGAIGLKVQHASFIRTCTQQGSDYLEMRLHPRLRHKLQLIYHGTTAGFRRAGFHKKDISEHEEVIVAIGRLIPKKGFVELLRAFALVAPKRPYCKLKIAGDGPGRGQLCELIRQLALENRVQLLGWQPPDMVARLLREATLLVAPSIVAGDGDRDGIPNVVLEAFASGIPVVASDLEGISEAVKHRQSGLLVKAGDTDELAAALKELLYNKDLRNQLSANAYKMVKERFNLTENAKQLAALFERAG